MKFGPLALEDAEGEILAHNVTDPTGRRILRKGRPLDRAALDALAEIGFRTVYVARLEDGDLHEDEAADRIGALLTGPGLSASPAHAGRVNVQADCHGVLGVDVDALLRLNGVDGLTVATLATHSCVPARARVATVKVIPYALPEAAVVLAIETLHSRPIVSLRPIEARSVGILLVGGRGAWDGLAVRLGSAIRERIESMGCRADDFAFSPIDEIELADALGSQITKDVAAVIVAGETAIMDEDDLIPRGLRRAGGRVEHLGLPMDPGQLLLLGYLEDTPVVGAPGCVRGSAPDGFDAVVPRLLAGEVLTRTDLEALGHGGLLSDPRGR